MIEVRLKKTGDKQVDQQALFVAGDLIYPGERYVAYPNDTLTILQNHPRIEIKGKNKVELENGIENQTKLEDGAEGNKTVEPPTHTPEEFAVLHFKTVEKLLPEIEDLEFLESAQKLAKSAVLDRINARIEEIHK